MKADGYLTFQFCAWVLGAVLSCANGWGQAITNATPGATSAPGFAFKQIGPGVFQFGTVTLDKSRRSVSWPISINMRTGVVEYAVVTAAGKTHESVFRTSSEPKDVHAALLLLGVTPAGTNQFPAELTTPIPGEPVGIEVSWKESGKEVRRPMESFVVTITNGAGLNPGPWTYNGSHFSEGSFAAQRDGSIISVHIDPGALINNPRPGRENDDLHYVNSAALPAADPPMEVTVRLLKEPVRSSRRWPPASLSQPGLLPAPPPAAGR
jgi:hypothetical protein